MNTIKTFVTLLFFSFLVSMQGTAQDIQLESLSGWKAVSCFSCFFCECQNCWDASTNTFIERTVPRDQKEVTASCENKYIGTWIIIREESCNGTYTYHLNLEYHRTPEGYADRFINTFLIEKGALDFIKSDAMAYYQAKESKKTGDEIARLLRKNLEERAKKMPESNIPETDIVNTQWYILDNAQSYRFLKKGYADFGAERTGTWRFSEDKKFVEITWEYLNARSKKEIVSIVRKDNHTFLLSTFDDEFHAFEALLFSRFNDSLQIYTDEAMHLDSVVENISAIRPCYMCLWLDAPYLIGDTVSVYSEAFKSKIPFVCKLIHNKPEWYCEVLGDSSSYYLKTDQCVTCKGSFARYSSPGYYKDYVGNDGVVYFERCIAHRTVDSKLIGKTYSSEELKNLTTIVDPQPIDDSFRKDLIAGDWYLRIKQAYEYNRYKGGKIPSTGRVHRVKFSFSVKEDKVRGTMDNRSVIFNNSTVKGKLNGAHFELSVDCEKYGRYKFKGEFNSRNELTGTFEPSGPQNGHTIWGEVTGRKQGAPK